MYNPYQPFMNLVNANMALFNRFATSGDITRLLHESVNRSIMISQERVMKAAQSGAFDELTRGFADNVARFTQEYANGLSQSMAYTQNFLSRQVDQGARQFAEIVEQPSPAADEAGEAGAVRQMKSAERTARSTAK